MSSRKARTLLSLLLLLLGLGIIAFNGVQAVVDRRLSDSLVVDAEVTQSGSRGAWRWIVGAGALTAGLALVGHKPDRR